MSFFDLTAGPQRNNKSVFPTGDLLTAKTSKMVLSLELINQASFDFSPRLKSTSVVEALLPLAHRNRRNRISDNIRCTATHVKQVIHA